MPSRKEERERLREIRRETEAREAREQRRRLLLGYGVAGLLAAAVIVGIVVVIASSGSGGASGEAHISTATGSTNGVPPDDRTGTEPPALEVSGLNAAALRAGCVLRMDLKDEGHDHIDIDAPTPDYKTNPPTSGAHAEVPFQQADGAYIEAPPATASVHSLEHGRIAIQYSPDLPGADQLQLKGLYDTMHAGALLYPNGEMPYEVAVTAWQHLMGCKTYKGAITLDAIRDFGRATWGRYGGEDVGTASGPTPVDPSA